MKKIDWNVWKPRALYGGFFALAFVVALRWTFPAEAVKERLILEAAAQGWQVDVDRVSASGVLGIAATGLTLEDRSGLKIPIDEVSASLRLLPLLGGRRSVAFDARLYDGRIRGTADVSGAQKVTARIEGVDLARAVPLRKASGMDLVGKLGGTVDVTLPEKPAEKPTGRIDLAIRDAGLAGGQLPIPGLGSGLSLPKLAFGQITAALKLDQGKGTFEKLEARGGDAELAADGLYFVLQPRLEFAPLYGKAKIRITDAFWAKKETASLKPIADAALASSKTPDGAYQFQIFGSLGHPNLRPAVGSSL